MRLALILALLLLAPSALAAVDTKAIDCPVDRTEVSVTVLMSSNALLGHDRDLCPHASDSPSEEIANSVSGCSTCGFAGTPGEFQAEIPESIAAKVKSSLKVATTPWERYANRAQIQEWAKAPEASIGESWLRAAWSVRLEERASGDPAIADATKRLLAGAPAGTQSKPAGAQSGDDVIAGDPILDPARALDLAEASATGADRAAGFYAAGALFRARGELAQAESRYVTALAAAAGTPLESSIKGVVDRDRESIALEKSYLGRALAHFKLALAAKSTLAERKPLLAFLAAECARRTGTNEEAAKLYRQAQSANNPDAQRTKLVEQGLAEVGAKSPKKKAK